jgi:two-component system C4-dicarboxylate transport response regulator DctD
VAHDADQAAERLREQTRVVLIDLRLPGADGGAIFRRVRAANPQARTVLITGYGAETEPLVQRLCAAGADAVCYKPFDVPRLLDALSELAGRRSGEVVRIASAPRLERLGESSGPPHRPVRDGR